MGSFCNRAAVRPDLLPNPGVRRVAQVGRWRGSGAQIADVCRPKPRRDTAGGRPAGGRPTVVRWTNRAPSGRSSDIHGRPSSGQICDGSTEKRPPFRLRISACRFGCASCVASSNRSVAYGAPPSESPPSGVPWGGGASIPRVRRPRASGGPFRSAVACHRFVVCEACFARMRPANRLVYQPAASVRPVHAGGMPRKGMKNHSPALQCRENAVAHNESRLRGTILRVFPDRVSVMGARVRLWAPMGGHILVLATVE